MKYSQFLKLLGPKTKRPPLYSKIISKTENKKIIIEKVNYCVENNERVNSYFITPINKKNLPVVICHHEHASKYLIAKSEICGLKGSKNLAFARELAYLGFATMAVDAIGFEERNKLKKNWWGVEYHEHASRIIQGKTLLEKNLSDLSAAVDYVCSRKEIDSSKIAFIGHSYGGRMAIIFPAFDKRIKVSVSNCFARKLKNSLDINAKTRIPMELAIPNILKYGDLDSFLKLSNKSNILLSVTKDDKWSQDAKEIYLSCKKYFKKKNLTLKIWPGNHKFTKKMKDYCYKYIKEKISN